MSKQINWFPGHMQQATNQFFDTLKKADGVIQIVDARAPMLCQNMQILKQINKPVITFAIKQDLAIKKLPNGISIFQKSDRSKVIKTLQQAFAAKIASKQKQGWKNPVFNLLVLGLPNVGKSSFINFLVGSKKAVVANKPGVTRNQQLWKVSEHFYLYDTPGICETSIENHDQAMVLALLGTINPNVLELLEVNEFAFNFLSKNQPKVLTDMIRQDLNGISFFEFMNLVGTKQGLITTNGKVDEARVNAYLFKFFSSNKNFKVSYE